MSFTVTCNGCGESNIYEKGDKAVSKYVEIGVSEDHGYQGSTVETIDLYCSNCENEVNL